MWSVSCERWPACQASLCNGAASDCPRGAFASQAGLPRHRLTGAVLREAGPSGSAPARRPAITPAARSRSRAPVNWEVGEEEEDFLERQVSPPYGVLTCWWNEELVP